MVHCYRLGGFNIVLDVASGSIHSVDGVAYDVISMFGREGKDEIIRRVKRDHAGITDGDLMEVFSDIGQLRRQGKLFSEDAFSCAAGPGRKGSLKALCLNVSHACNMACSYCFAGRGGYGGDEGLMSLATGKRAIDFLLGSSGARRNLDVDFFGGEPLLNWGVVKGIVGYARAQEQGSGKRFRFTLTTNGLLIDDDVITFTNREMDNVVLSLDGRPTTNDAARKLRGGGGSYAGVVPKIKRLVEARRGRGYYIRGTFTRENLDFVSDILHIADLGFRELSMEPVVAEPCDPLVLTMDDLPVICEQYEMLAAEMLRRNKEGRGFTFYHYMIDLTGGPCVHKRIAGCGVGAGYLAVTPQGELYPCHQFVGNERFLMGDVWRGITNVSLQDEFGAYSIYSRAECRECWARLYCSGGCAANAYNATGSVGGTYELGCAMFKKRMECAIMLKVSEYVEGTQGDGSLVLTQENRPPVSPVPQDKE